MASKPGEWWVIVDASSWANNTILYWQGTLHTNGLHRFAFDHAKAAQFATKESAEFQARMLAVPEPWRAECHSWA